MDELAVWVPSLDASTPMEAEQHGYHHSQAIDLGPVMPAMQFRVTDEVGTYLCVVQALVFKGSVLAYNPARDEAEWGPTCGLTDDLTWAEEKSAMALANYVPRIPQEATRIARLGAHRLMSWLADSSMSEEEEEEQEEEEGEEKESWNQVGNDNHEIGGWPWKRRNVLPSMTHSWILTSQLMATP